jgi:hypothetical protein
MPQTEDELHSMLVSIDWNRVFELHKLFNLHNHEMIDYNTLETIKHPLALKSVPFKKEPKLEPDLAKVKQEE